MKTEKDLLLVCRLVKTRTRLTFDILEQHPRVTFQGDDDGPYFKFTASNGYEVISRSRMDIQTERLWLFGGTNDDKANRSGTMIFSNDHKRNKACDAFVQALQEWAQFNEGEIDVTVVG